MMPYYTTNIMPKDDFNFRGSDDILNNRTPHWPRTRHYKKNTQLTEKRHFQNMLESNLRNFATDDEKWVT